MRDRSAQRRLDTLLPVARGLTVRLSSALRVASRVVFARVGIPLARRLDERVGRMIGAGLVAASFVLPSPLFHRAVTLGVDALMSAGAWQVARGITESLGLVKRDRMRSLQHDLWLRLGEIGLAERVTLERHRSGALSTYEAGLLAADDALAGGDPTRALAILEGDRRLEDERWVRRAAVVLLRLGRPAELLEMLSSSAHDPSSGELVAARFDAHWALGDVDAALAEVDSLARLPRRDLAMTARLHQALVANGLSSDEALREILAIETDRSAVPNAGWTARLGATVGLVDDVARLGAGARSSRVLGPTAAMDVANALYVRRDFAGAREVLSGLRGTRVHRAAEKLESRILLEEGEFEQAYEHRRLRVRPNEELDEVSYFAALHLGRFDEAFSTYLARSDRMRLVATFGEAAELSPHDGVATRFVIAQNGPGDEILHAATYPWLLRRSDQLQASCEPRLESLLRRSFPEIEFFPAERAPSNPRPGFLGPRRPPRADGVFHDLLSPAAMEAARRADRVVLGRSLPRLAPAVTPAAPYLVADHTLVESARQRFDGSPIGVVWRSEFASAIRSIHYLKPSDLAPLAELGRPIVCLQHDVTDDERFELREALDGGVDFIDDIDLRNDFESTLAVVTSCRAVVGIGTTMIELAAAGGVPTIALHPNRIGAWRRRADGVSDYWHATMRVALADEPARPSTCVDVARFLLSADGV